MKEEDVDWGEIRSWRSRVSAGGVGSAATLPEATLAGCNPNSAGYGVCVCVGVTSTKRVMQSLKS